MYVFLLNNFCYSNLISRVVEPQQNGDWEPPLTKNATVAPPNGNDFNFKGAPQCQGCGVRVEVGGDVAVPLRQIF